MTLLAYSVSDTKPAIAQWVILVALGVATVGCLAGAAATMVMIDPKYRHTFYRHETNAQYK